MKIRIEYKQSQYLSKWVIKEKKWYGWKTIYDTYNKYNLDRFLQDLTNYRQIEIIKE